jgi:hypothetical protein
MPDAGVWQRVLAEAPAESDMAAKKIVHALYLLYPDILMFLSGVLILSSALNRLII